MKTFSCCWHLALVSLIAPATLPADMGNHEQWPLSYWYVGGEVGYYMIEQDDERTGQLPDFWRPSFQVGRRFNRYLSSQLQFGQADRTLRDSEQDVEHSQLSLQARLHGNGINLFSTHPYLGLGYARHELTTDSQDSTEENMVLVEIGVQRLLGQHLMLDVGYRHLVDTGDNFTDRHPYIALNYRLGQRYPEPPAPAPKPTPPPAPEPWQDSDGDGVEDRKDKCPDTPRGAKVDAEGCPIMLTESVNITLDIEFAFNSTEVPARYLADIGKIATVMVEYPESQLMLEGHTDSIGRATYNQALSQARASAVKRVLIDRFRIDASRIDSIGLGESQPVADNATEAGRARNRRVEAIIEASRQVMEQKQSAD
ncbi:OmpA family protein [Alcanivorax sp. NBRC 102024]|jgi:OOP family OmpA-OmpF porin|uniref:OmpA family protein n=1 Tax=Alcanivorax sp. NBRC 102024 TaxID=1113895 RepID=UPI000789E42B|nr:OmpA family protein [Alcanivorax sp. NBRC 102024]